MSLLRETHGGRCCGIHHIWNFPLGTFHTPAERTAMVQQLVDESSQYQFDTYDGDSEEDTSEDTYQTAVECVLTDGQLNQGWRDTLIDFGFKPVFRFHNNNSGNDCTVFYYGINNAELEIQS